MWSRRREAHVLIALALSTLACLSLIVEPCGAIDGAAAGGPAPRGGRGGAARGRPAGARGREGSAPPASQAMPSAAGDKKPAAPPLRGAAPRGKGRGGAAVSPKAQSADAAPKTQVLKKTEGVDPKTVADVAQKLEAVVIGDDTGKQAKPASTAGSGSLSDLCKAIFKMKTDEERSKATSDLVAKVREGGVGTLETGGVTEALKEAFEEGTGKAAAGIRLGALAIVTAVFTEFGAGAEPFFLPLMGDVIDSYGLKGGGVNKATHEALNKMKEHFTPSAVRLALPALYECARHEKGLVKEETLKLFSEMAKGDTAESIAQELYDILPVLTELMWDSQDHIVQAATQAMEDCTDTANNRDLKPFTPDVIKSILHPDTVPECVHKLAATVFVQEIKSPALAVTVPLLIRGLQESETVIRRKACTIVDNMCKMIEHPEEAVAFMPRILPLVRKASEDIPDPEAREVATRALKTLTKIEQGAVESKTLDPKAVLDILSLAMEGLTGADKPGFATATLHVAKLASVLISNRVFEKKDWSDVVNGGLGLFLGEEAAKKVSGVLLERCFKETRPREAAEDEDEEGEDLCNIEFSLGYGALMLLTNTRLHMKRGKRYGLCGPNGCGKSTLMKAIVNGQVDGFPPPEELKTVYVEHDIQGDHTNVSVEEFVYNRVRDDPDTRVSSQTREEVRRVLGTVGFTEEMLGKSVTALSGGWKMKVALARAMLMKADIYMLDEPTNHLDVDNVKWLEDYLNSLTEVTSMLVSHDSGFLDRVCTHITHFEGNRKLKTYRGNLSEFVKAKPEAKVYYELTDEFLQFKLPKPGFLEGVKSKGKPILKMTDCYFTYPGTSSPQVLGMSIAASLLSRVAVIGPNGAGKSTMIKLLTGELTPDSGDVWKHPNMRIAYVAQHAFHHVEKHLDRTPNEYIQWRYAGGEDKEGLAKESAQITDEEKAKMKSEQMIQNADGTIEKRVLEEILTRRKSKNTYEYEIKWVGLNSEKNSWLERDQLVEMGFEKPVNRFDEREALRLGTSGKALTAKNVEKALGDMGLEAEFATHNRIRGLSGGQKVKVVLTAAMWEDPHILVLDEPTNYLDRDSLGALAAAIKDFEGGVIMISHNREFTRHLCSETWICERGRLRREGESFTEDIKIHDPNKIALTNEPEKVVKDSFGNVIKVKRKQKLTGKELKKYKKMKESRRQRGEEVSESDEE